MDRAICWLAPGMITIYCSSSPQTLKKSSWWMGLVICHRALRGKKGNLSWQFVFYWEITPLLVYASICLPSYVACQAWMASFEWFTQECKGSFWALVPDTWKREIGATRVFWTQKIPLYCVKMICLSHTEHVVCWINSYNCVFAAHAVHHLHTFCRNMTCLLVCTLSLCIFSSVFVERQQKTLKSRTNILSLTVIKLLTEC